MLRRSSLHLSLLLLWTAPSVFSALLPFDGTDPVIVVDNDDLTLKQVHVITRSGSRYPLLKGSSVSVISHSPGTLTRKGEEQMTEVGRFLKDRYADSLASIGGAYDAASVKLMSSGLDRTIVSALSLAAGLWDETKRDPSNEANGTMRQNVAVYSQNVQDDVTIRAFDKCPRYNNDLRQVYNSPHWLEKEYQNIDLLQRLAKTPAFRRYVANSYGADGEEPKIALQNLYTVYDMITIAMTECNVNTERLACMDIPLADEVGRECDNEQKIRMEQNVTKACNYLGFSAEEVLAPFQSGLELQTLMELVHEAELFKYGTNLAGKYTGGTLLFQILEAMTEDTYMSQTFFLYSAHYQTILGLFAALDNIAPTAPNVIPSFASALIFEMYESSTTKDKFLKIMYRTLDDDSESGEMQMINVPLGNICGSESHWCALETLHQYVKLDLDARNWCEVCGNYDAATCARDSVYECEDEAFGWIIATLLIGLFVGAFLPKFFAWCCCCCGGGKRKSSVSQEKEEEQSPDFTEENTGNASDDCDATYEEAVASASDDDNNNNTDASSSVRSPTGKNLMLL